MENNVTFFIPSSSGTATYSNQLQSAAKCGTRMLLHVWACMNINAVTIAIHTLSSFTFSMKMIGWCGSGVKSVCKWGDATTCKYKWNKLGKGK